ncbi:hypothetical protein AAVH_23916 [Aphelenchoides avenae]|nr:hypothetical protein AAVH_23916 [Aphelenchus avenae]
MTARGVEEPGEVTPVRIPAALNAAAGTVSFFTLTPIPVCTITAFVVGSLPTVFVPFFFSAVVVTLVVLALIVVSATVFAVIASAIICFVFYAIGTPFVVKTKHVPASSLALLLYAQTLQLLSLDACRDRFMQAI